MQQEEKQEKSREGRVLPPLRIRTVGTIAAVIAIIISVLALYMLGRVGAAINDSQQIHNAHTEFTQVTADLVSCSDKLTSLARLYVAEGKEEDLNDYISELASLRENNQRLDALKSELGGTKAYTALFDASAETNSLAKREMRAIRLSAEARNFDDLPEEFAEITLSDEQEALSSDGKQELASELLTGEQYRTAKNIVITRTNDSTTSMVEFIRSSDKGSNEQLDTLFNGLRVIIIALLLIILITLLLNFRLIVVPMIRYAQNIRNGEKLALAGAYELRLVTDAYNAMYEDLSSKNQMLMYEAEHDPLTGLMNRGTYDRLLAEDTSVAGLVLIDVDYFKQVNDSHGHQAGDAVLKRVAEVLTEGFKGDAQPCRVGGDEFSLLITNPDLKRADVEERVARIRPQLAEGKPGRPPVTLSIGVAFRTDKRHGERLYRAADEALYIVKTAGRNGIAFASDEQ